MRYALAPVGTVTDTAIVGNLHPALRAFANIGNVVSVDKFAAADVTAGATSHRVIRGGDFFRSWRA